jgi:hypothetical protein
MGSGCRTRVYRQATIVVLLIQVALSQSYGACLAGVELTCTDTLVIDVNKLISAKDNESHWQPELEISYMAGDQDNSLVFLSARLVRLQNSFSFAGVEASVTFAEADLSSSSDFIHVQGTLSSLVDLPVSSSSTYSLRATFALGVVFGGAQDADGDDLGYTEGIVGFQVEPRAVFRIKNVLPQLVPIVSLGYLQVLGSHTQFDTFRLGIGVAF